VYEPRASAAGVCDVADEHAPKLGVPVSTEHSTVAAPSAVNPNVGVVFSVAPLGPLVIVISATVSIVN
jgi:hypothetical protein